MIDGVEVPGKTGAHLVRPLDFSVAVVRMGKVGLMSHIRGPPTSLTVEENMS